MFRAISLSVVVLKEYTRSMRICIKPSAGSRPATRRVINFVDAHCVRRTTPPRNGNVRRDSEDVVVWEHKGLLLVNVRSRFELCVIVQTYVAQFLFDIPSNLFLSGGLAQWGSSRDTLWGHGQPNEGWRDVEQNRRGWALCATHRYQNPSLCPSCVPERTKTKTAWIASTLRGGRGKQQSVITIKVGAVDLGSRPQGSTPRSPRHERATHIWAKTPMKNDCLIKTQTLTADLMTQVLSFARKNHECDVSVGSVSCFTISSAPYFAIRGSRASTTLCGCLYRQLQQLLWQCTLKTLVD